MIGNRKVTDDEIESDNKLWESKVIFGSEDLMLASEFSKSESIKKLESDMLTFKDFLQNSSAQSLGKFGEFLFAKFCKSKEINYKGQHKGGVDFIINADVKVDVKAVRHLKTDARHRFRRHNIEKQLPQVHYAYIIFWNNSVELRFEINDAPFGNYDCIFEDELINKAWQEFDKKSIKFLDVQHVQNTKMLKVELKDWINDNFGIKARVIQRKSTAALGLRNGGWGADNFYQKPPHKHELVVLLCVDDGSISYIHSYPTSEYLCIEVRPKPVGTNRKEILCYDVSKLSDRYKFIDLDDFKLNAKKRFGF